MALTTNIFRFVLCRFWINNGNGLEGFRQISSFIVVFEQLIVCVQYI